MTLDSEYRRGYEDGFHGRDRGEPDRSGALNSFLDGFFGSRWEDEVSEAYDRGYREGSRERSRESQAVPANR
jgi:ribosome modulation factor